MRFNTLLVFVLACGVANAFIPSQRQIDSVVSRASSSASSKASSLAPSKAAKRSKRSAKFRPSDEQKAAYSMYAPEPSLRPFLPFYVPVFEAAKVPQAAKAPQATEPEPEPASTDVSVGTTPKAKGAPPKRERNSSFETKEATRSVRVGSFGALMNLSASRATMEPDSTPKLTTATTTTPVATTSPVAKKEKPAVKQESFYEWQAKTFDPEMWESKKKTKASKQTVAK